MAMRRNITEALLDRELLDFGGPFVSGRSLVVAVLQAPVGIVVAGVSTRSVLGGVAGVRLGDWLARGEFRLPAKEFAGPLGSFTTR